MAFSPLLFEEDNYESPTEKSLSINEPSVPFNSSDTIVSEVKSVEQRLVERLRTVLIGVPPPPTVTVSQYDASEILQCLNGDIYEKFQWIHSRGDVSKSGEDKTKAETEKWPQVRDHFWFNVCYNRGVFSEELALLTAKYQERYVGNETSSSCNSFFTKSPVRTASAKKRARRHAWGHSPGRRLSHLARRRHTFSSVNLQQNASKSLPDKKKMILVDKRKSDMSKRGRNSVAKSSGNTKNKSGNQLTILAPKRALFQSPENEKKSSVSNKRLVLSDKSKLSSHAKTVQQSKRALWPDLPVLKQEGEKDKENGCFNLNGKRVLEARCNSDLTAKKKCLRSLSFSEEQDSGDKVMPKLLPENLNHLHKQKLLWAVSDALRNEGIEMEHKHFKVYMHELFKICKEVWLIKCVKEKGSGSTSEKMSKLVNKFSSEVVKKVKVKLEGLKSDNNPSNCENSDNSFNSILSTAVKDDLKNPVGEDTFNNMVGVLAETVSGQVIEHNIIESNGQFVKNQTVNISSCRNINDLNVFGDSGINKCNSGISNTVECNLGKEAILKIANLKNVPLHQVSISHDDEKAVCRVVDDDGGEFSPCPSLINDDTRGSSSCDIDVGKIIGIIDCGE